MINRLNQLWQKSFVRNVATLQAGSFAGSIIQAGIGIIIARLLQPELFGVYALVLAVSVESMFRKTSILNLLWKNKS